MKSFRLCAVLCITFILVTLPHKSFSQVNVNSSSGYTVHITATPVSIIPSSYSCTYGYNYNVRVSYVVTFTGSNIPASLYTLQGYVNCNNSMNFFDIPNNGGSGIVTSTSNQWNPHSDCSTVTVASFPCNSVSIDINGIGIAAQTIIIPVTYVPLPVQLISFTAVEAGDKVKVKWATATETNNGYFTVQRSTDVNQWTDMKRINGAGNSTSLLNYEWDDEAPLHGTSNYRLKQTDIDGHISYSEIKTVQYSVNENHVSIYPVPNTGNTITLSGLPDYNNHELSVINSAGATVFATALSSFSVSLPALLPGVYIVSVKNKLTGNSSNLHYIKL